MAGGICPKGHTLNEKITELEDALALLTPHSHAQQAGILANSSILSSEDTDQLLTINFQVPKTGCNIKENSRFAAVFLLSS